MTILAFATVAYVNYGHRKLQSKWTLKKHVDFTMLALCDVEDWDTRGGFMTLWVVTNNYFGSLKPMKNKLCKIYFFS